MIESIIASGTSALDWWFNTWYGVFYYLPASICLVVYTLRTIDDLADDKRHVAEHLERVQEWEMATKNSRNVNPPEYYHTHRTIGYILGRWVVASLPVVNVFLAVFDCLEDVVDKTMSFFQKILNIDIIPKPKEK